MKTPYHANHKPNKSAKLEARCSPNLRLQFVTLAAVREADISDIVREACIEYAARFKAHVQSQSLTI